MATPLTDAELDAHSDRVINERFVPFERLLDGDWNLAMSEGSHFLQGTGAVHETLQRLTRRLNELGIPYALAGGMALYSHGFRRVTEDIDLIVTKEDLRLVHQKLDGLGYLRPFETSKNLRDVQSKVKIEFLIAGEFPGDGRPKPISFPDPRDAAMEKNGVFVLKIPNLIELKLASGMTGAGRMKDLGDVEQLIKLLNIPRNMSEQLNPYVKAKFLELWDGLHSSARRYVFQIRSKRRAGEVKTIEGLIAAMPDSGNDLAAMRADGVFLDPRSDSSEGFAYLITTDAEVAKKYNMQPEDEVFFDEA